MGAGGAETYATGTAGMATEVLNNFFDSFG